MTQQSPTETPIESRALRCAAAFVERTRPQWMLPTAPVPDAFTREGGTPQERAELCRQARIWHRAKGLYDFTEAIAQKGWRPQELATGYLPPNTGVSMDGSVQRNALPRSVIPSSLRRRADAVIAAVARRPAALDVLRTQLMHEISRGTYPNPQGAHALVEEAELTLGITPVAEGIA